MVGGDFSLGFRLGALDAKADLNDAESHEHHHFPYARRLRLGWRRDADGRWIADREDKRLWECSVPSAPTMTDPPRTRQKRYSDYVGPTPMSTRRSTSQRSISVRTDPHCGVEMD